MAQEIKTSESRLAFVKKITLTFSVKLFVMNKKVSLNIFLFLVFAMVAISIISCNKGYGCPTNF